MASEMKKRDSGMRRLMPEGRLMPEARLPPETHDIDSQADAELQTDTKFPDEMAAEKAAGSQ